MRGVPCIVLWMMGILMLTSCNASPYNHSVTMTTQADVTVETEAALSAELTNALLFAKESLCVELCGEAQDCDAARVFDAIQQNDALARCGLRRCSWRGVSEKGVCQLWFTMEYMMGAATFAQKQQTEQAAMRMAQSVFTLEQSAGEKVLLAHDVLCAHCSYDEAAPTAHSAYGALCAGAAVCEGYAEAFALLMAMGDVPCKIICGTAKSGGVTVPHAWNLVQLEGAWYHVDVTWDDAQGVYDFFLCSDAVFKQTHAWDQSSYPAATGGTLRYDVLREMLGANGAQAQTFSLVYQSRLTD